jgi:ADP-heptose:LPS heptosyltransferase
MKQMRWVNLFYWLCDPVVRIFPRWRRPDTGKKTVLLLRMDSVGDFILWLDSARAYREIYPEDRYRIVLCAHQNWVDLARQCPYWDEVLTVDPPKFVKDAFYRWQLLRGIYLRNFDVAIQPVFSRVMALGDSVIRASQAAEKIGWRLYEESNTPLFRLRDKVSSAWYTKLVSLENDRWMELERNAHFVRALGVTGFRSGVPRLLLHKTRPAGLRETYCVVVPDSLWDGKEWPLENFIEIAKRIQKVTGWQVIFLGVRKELSPGVDEAVGGMDAVNLIGGTKFLEYVNIIAGAQMVVANDSSAVHIAAACDVQAFSITGGGAWGRFLPYRCDIDGGRKPVVINEMMDCYGCGWHCRFPRTRAVKCVKEISVDKGWSIIENMIHQQQ